MPSTGARPSATRSPRYEVVTDPLDRHVVWDIVSSCPAVSGSEPLSYETLGEAALVAARMNEPFDIPARIGGRPLAGNAVQSWA